MPSGVDPTRESRRRGTQGENRRALATALFVMLKTTHVRDIRIGDITAAVGVTQPNFYNHFKDLKEALIASAEIGWSQYPTNSQLIGPHATLADARRIVEPIIDFWIENGASLAWGYYTDAVYEPALIALRQQATAKLIQAIVDCIDATRTLERVPSAAHPLAWAQITLNRIDSFGLGFQLMRQYGNIERHSIIDTAAAMLLSDLGITAITAQTPPAPP
jgi:AcrR family transcriptional regulator